MNVKNENRPGYRKTKIGWIPENWTEITLEQFTNWYSGGTPSKGNDSYWNGDIPWISAISMRETRFYDSELKITHAGLRAGTRLATKNSILLLVRGSMLFKRIPVGIACRDVAFNQDVKSIVPNKEKASPEYLLFWFLGNEHNLLGMVERTGIGAGKLDYKKLLGLRIFLPPLPEQEAIAGVLECWDKAIRNYEQKIEKKRNIKKGLIQRLFSGKQRLPGFSGEWKEIRLEDIGRFSKGKGISKEEVSDTGLPCIRYGEIYTSDEYIITRFRSFINSKLAKQCTLIKENDLLLAGSGETISEIGKSIAYMGTEEAYAGGDIIIFSAFKASARGDYLSFYLNTQGRRALGRLGQGQSVVHIYTKNIANLCFPLPAIEEQQAIASVLSAANSEIDAMEQKLALLKDQKKFLLNNLVMGTIRLPHFRGRTINTGADGDHA